MKTIKTLCMRLIIVAITLMAFGCSEDDNDSPTLYEFTTNMTVSYYYEGLKMQTREVFEVVSIREYYDSDEVRLTVINDCVGIEYPGYTPEILDICGVIRVILNNVEVKPIQ